ncbi:PIN domain-containing protein [Candidatus Halobeggiatoa sp. HSG11]|nr:PIN domain-containing protein [Candidatus Halobeggiatoa sp. HSG11]
MIIADTGFWVALADDADQHHKLAISKLEYLKEPLITTWPVLTEVCHLLLKRRGIDAELGFIRSYHQGAFLVFDLNESHNDKLLKLMEKYSDLPMDLADASLVILAEELGNGQILSTDQRDFQTYRWKNTYPFHNILLEQ